VHKGGTELKKRTGSRVKRWGGDRSIPRKGKVRANDIRKIKKVVEKNERVGSQARKAKREKVSRVWGEKGRGKKNKKRGTQKSHLGGERSKGGEGAKKLVKD